jgi:hypothetical protein
VGPLEAMQECGYLSPPFLCGFVDVRSFAGPHHLDVRTLSRACDEGSARLRPPFDFPEFQAGRGRLDQARLCAARAQ